MIYKKKTPGKEIKLKRNSLVIFCLTWKSLCVNTFDYLASLILWQYTNRIDTENATSMLV